MPMKRKYIAEQFDSYLRLVLDPNSPAIQIEECKRAFYAGALALQTVIMHGLSPGLESTPLDEQFMKDLYAELLEFGRTQGAKV